MAAGGNYMHFAGAAAALATTAVALDRRVRLDPGHGWDEAAFWDSGTTDSMLRAYDLVAGASVSLTLTSLHRKLSRVWLDKVADTCYPDRWSYTVDMVAYHWHMHLFLAMAVLQIVAVAAAPALYSRWRHRWIGANRVFRLAVTYLHSVSLSGRTLAWQHISDALLEAPSPATALLLAYSGASLGVLHNINMFLPLRWSTLYQLALSVVLVLLMAPTIALELLRPEVVPSYLGVCRPVVCTLGDLTGVYVTEGEAEAWCTEHPQLVVVVCQVLVGCVAPLAIGAAVEGAAKGMYMQQRRRLEQQQQQQEVEMGQQVAGGLVGAHVAHGVRAAINGGGGGTRQPLLQQPHQDQHWHEAHADGFAVAADGNDDDGVAAAAPQQAPTLVWVWLVEARRVLAMLLATFTVLLVEAAWETPVTA